MVEIAPGVWAKGGVRVVSLNGDPVDDESPSWPYARSRVECTMEGCGISWDHYHRDTLDGEEVVPDRPPSEVP
jgi:hypothetical protein